MASRCQEDRLKGFAHFKAFAELGEWHENNVDPLQRSNTPLLPRPRRDHSAPDGKSNVMLIHDYAGGYKKYESCQGLEVDDQCYSCEYLQYVETFVYFTHALVSIPPPTWTSTCHRNGVKVLGTFLVESGSQGVESIVEQRDGKFWLATRLSRMAQCYGFDGWLINIECQIPMFFWKVEKLEGFLNQLRADLGPKGKVVWYDALTVINTVWYQNTLSPLNLRFALAAGSILTNYAWTPEKAQSAKTVAKQVGMSLEDVYFGIDVWAQNTQRGPNKRITYPKEGGGGTGTGLGVKELAKYGLSAGVFAPAWSFEHFPRHGRQIEGAIWEGTEIPPNLSCDCGAVNIHTSVPYRRNPLQHFARQHHAGSHAFFHTNFKRAFSHTAREHQFHKTLRANLAQQSVLPTESSSNLFARASTTGPSHPDRCGTLNALVHDLPASLEVSVSIDSMFDGDSSSTLIGRLNLYDLCIQPSDEIRFSVSYSKPMSPRGTCAWLRLTRLNGYHEVSFPREAVTRGEMNLALVDTTPHKCNPSGPVTGIEVHVLAPVKAFTETSLHLLQMLSMTLQSPDCGHDEHGIHDLRLEERGDGALKHHRLVWSMSSTGDATSSADNNCAEPHSRVTGSFSHFVISANGEDLGQAYALEFVVDQQIIEKWREARTIDALVVGIGFDGAALDKARTVFDLPFCSGEDWIVV